jgi:signal transduction histidine kinase
MSSVGWLRKPSRPSPDVRPPYADRGTASERVIANIRILFAAVSLFIAFVTAADPNRISLTYAVLAGYMLYSVGLLLAIRRGISLSRGRVLLIHSVDVVTAAVFTALAAWATSPLLISFGFVLLAAGYRWGLWETVWTGGVSAVLFSGKAILLTSSPAGTVGSDTTESFLIRVGFLVLFTVMIGYLGEQQRIGRAELAASAAAAERARLARELHDGVIQSLIAVKMRVEVLRRSLSPDSPAIDELQDNEAMLAREVVNLRMLMFELTPSNETPVELSSQLQDLVERFQHASGVEAKFVATGQVSQASPQVCHEIIRMVQESLVNIHKHSGATKVLVRLSEKPDRWELSVEDDGRGFDFEGRVTDAELGRTSKGPRIIRERAHLLGGSVTIESTPGSGAKVTVSLPLQT